VKVRGLESRKIDEEESLLLLKMIEEENDGLLVGGGQGGDNPLEALFLFLVRHVGCQKGHKGVIAVVGEERDGELPEIEL